jgi:hypothetical protein
MGILEFAEKYRFFYDKKYLKWVDNVPLMEYEKQFLINLIENRFTIDLHSRQIGISTLMATYCAYNLIFGLEERILFIGCRLENAHEFINQVKPILSNYYESNNKKLNLLINRQGEIELENKNKLTTRGMSLDSLRGVNFNKIIVENPSGNPNFKEINRTISYIFSQINKYHYHIIGQICYQDLFYELFIGDNIFKKSKWHYSLNSGRYPATYIQELKGKYIDEIAWQQEMELELVFTKNHINKKNLIQCRVDNEFFNKIGKRLIEMDCSLSEYMRGLIEKDLTHSN